MHILSYPVQQFPYTCTDCHIPCNSFPTPVHTVISRAKVSPHLYRLTYSVQQFPHTCTYCHIPCNSFLTPAQTVISRATVSKPVQTVTFCHSSACLCHCCADLRQHEKCTRNIAVESSHCIQEESREFKKDLSAVALRQGRTNQKALMDLGCR